MIQIVDITRQLPFFPPIPLTDLPLIYHPEHHFPYTSYGDTGPSARLCNFRMVRLENEFLRVEVAPELGGRVYSLFDKRIGQEILFSNPVVKPVRILPVWGFISGGIEFNFPIAHSPTSLQRIGCVTGQQGDYGFIRVGEREARTGMDWVVEVGLVSGVPVLVQRTALRNSTAQAHPWMMWTICAVRSTEGTEFVHPPHRVLVHDHRVAESDWPGEGLNWNRNFREMTALFWKPGSSPAFGAFHHDLGFGLMHWAEPAQLPGKKVWTYGFGKHLPWGIASTEGDSSVPGPRSIPFPGPRAGGSPQDPARSAPASSRPMKGSYPLRTRDRPRSQRNSSGAGSSGAGPFQVSGFRFHPSPLSYAEIESGPLLDQSEKPLFPSGREQRYEEFWIPVHSRADCDRLQCPKLALPPMQGPWLGWKHSPWQSEWEAFCAGQGPLPDSQVPTGLELETALRAKSEKGNAAAAEALALWLCFRGRTSEALPLVESSALQTSRRVAGLILWKKKQNPAAAVAHLEAGPLQDPVAVVELDELYAVLGLTGRRQALLAGTSDFPGPRVVPHSQHVRGAAHRLIIERRAQLALELGRPEETLRILRETSWPREHQRYVRTDLWRAACRALGKPDAEAPETLNEDNLARFGAYWSEP